MFEMKHTVLDVSTKEHVNSHISHRGIYSIEKFESITLRITHDNTHLYWKKWKLSMYTCTYFFLQTLDKNLLAYLKKTGVWFLGSKMKRDIF